MLIINGVPVAILKRRHWGERCNSCYDKTTRDVNRSKCIVCYGTGFKFGYFDPVYTKVKRSAPESNSQLTPEGRIDSNSTKIHCAYTPQLDTQDIIVFLRDNRRFIVDQQTETQITTVTVHQVVNALELSRDNIAFRLKVDNKAIQALY
jgi:RecJ-like exonuclease